MKSDIEIAQSAKLISIVEIGKKVGLGADDVECYGKHKAKIDLGVAMRLAESKERGKLILVTAMSPTPAGEGKTTTTVGLCDAINARGALAVACLREPSLGPVFGLKGGAAGGGFAQVAPMEEINLHFTGDFHAVASAHNLLSAMLDNHIHHGNELKIDARRVFWKRAMDMNDRALRQMTVGLGGAANGFAREDGFDIVVASEVMAILCLASSMEDLKARLGRIVVAESLDGHEVSAGDLMAAGAMCALLRDAIKPNIAQTLEGNAALIHGGPFANIAHGCNSVLATKAALGLAPYVVTEAGFGADLGAEKFLDIKCRLSGLWPDACVVVATLRALRYHGGADKGEWGQPSVERVRAGLPNLIRHASNVTQVYGLPAVVALNHFAGDTPEEIEVVREALESLGLEVVECRHWAEGGAGAARLADAAMALCARPRQGSLVYPDESSLVEKIEAVAKKVYGAGSVVFDEKAAKKLARWEKDRGRMPVCMAKTAASFSADASVRGAPSGHELRVKDVKLSAGAGFVVALCGDVMTMPGLPKDPAAHRIDVSAGGVIEGLF